MTFVMTNNSMVSCGRSECPVEQAWQGHKRSADMLAFVLMSIPRERARDLLVTIGVRYGRQYEVALRADLRSRLRRANDSVS